MSDRAWRYCDRRSEKVTSTSISTQTELIEVQPPPGEPHPDQLKRCEVCKYSIRRGGSAYKDSTEMCEHPGVSIKEDDGHYYGIELPPTRTCKHWTYDQHNTDTQETNNGMD